MKKNKVEWIKGFATIKGPGKVEVTTDKGVQTLETKNILIATGSEARMLPGLQPDADLILTNIEILNLQSVPKSLMIIGAGAVGVEFASMFKRFGTDVSIFEMLPRIVNVEDEEVSKQLERSFKKQGIRCEPNAQVDLASVEGLEGITIGRLAGELQMSKSGLIGRFGDKEAMQRAVLASVIRSHAQKL